MISYDDLEDARAKRAAQEAPLRKRKRSLKRKNPVSEAGAPELARIKVARMSEASELARAIVARETWMQVVLAISKLGNGSNNGKHNYSCD